MPQANYFCQPCSNTYSRRRSVSIAALSAGSVTPSSFATCPHRIGRRLDFREVGQDEQLSTSRSPFAGRCFAAHRWQVVRSLNTRAFIVKIRPALSQAWKCPSGSFMPTIVAQCNNCCNASLRSAPSAPPYAQVSPKAPMASQARLAGLRALSFNHPYALAHTRQRATG